MAADVASALDYLHTRAGEEKIIHRDVKAQNVLVTGKGATWHAKLTGFGLSRTVGARARSCHSPPAVSFLFSRTQLGASTMPILVHTAYPWRRRSRDGARKLQCV